MSFAGTLRDPRAWTPPRKILDGGEWYPQVAGLEPVTGTDKQAGRRARFLLMGRSDYYIDFFRTETLRFSPLRMPSSLRPVLAALCGVTLVAARAQRVHRNEYLERFVILINRARNEILNTEGIYVEFQRVRLRTRSSDLAG